MQFWAAKLSAFDVLKAITCWMIFFHDFIAHTTTFTVGKNSYFLTSGITYTAKSPKITFQYVAQKIVQVSKKFYKIAFAIFETFQKSNKRLLNVSKNILCSLLCIP